MFWKATSKQDSQVSPDSFKNHQNDPVFNWTFLEGLDEELVILLKQNKLSWMTTYADKLAHQLFKTIQKEVKDKTTKTMSLQLQQQNDQGRQAFFTRGKESLLLL